MKIFKKEYDREYVLYGGLIITFAILYLATAFVSFYHAITFFHIANAIWLSVILSFVAEIGQASVLFSILLTENKKQFLPWLIMIILTSLQVIGNVVSSFDWIIAHNDAGLDGFKRSILFAVQTDDPEMFRVIVAWISGALLPVIALSMTALVAQNMDLRAKKTKVTPESSGSTISQETSIEAKDIISEVSRIRPTQEELDALEKILKAKSPIITVPKEENAVTDSHTHEDPEESEEPDDDFGSVDLSDEIPDQIPQGAPFDEPIYNPDLPLPSLSDEEVHIMNLDEHERKTESEITDEVDEVIPEIIIPHTNGLVDNSTPPTIKFSDKIVETPVPNQDIIPPPPPDNHTDQYISQEQLDKIRQIARENLKKK